MTERTRVGTYTITTSTVYQTSYECAAWYTDVRVEPGDYPVYAYLRSERGIGSLGHTLYVDVDGVIVDASFQTLWCGVPVRGARDHGPDDVGKPSKASVRISTTSMHADVESGALQLIPAVVGREYPSTRSVWDSDSSCYREQPCIYTFYEYLREDRRDAAG